MELAKGSKGTGGELPLLASICVHDEQHIVILGIVLAPIVLCVDDILPVRRPGGTDIGIRPDSLPIRGIVLIAENPQGVKIL
jgi:hypothetical protein